MTTVKNEGIEKFSTSIQAVDLKAQARGSVTPLALPSDSISILQYHASFADLVGPEPTHSLLLSSAETSRNPFFHEACVYIPAHDELYTTSNLLAPAKSATFHSILISRIKFHRTGTRIHAVDWNKMRPPKGIDMPNGGVNYMIDDILFCAQGSASVGTGGIYHMPRNGVPEPLVTNFHGRDFNSPNDVVVAKDGSIWFSDPCYGHEQDFRQKQQLPCQIYRFDPATADLRVVVDGLDRPNGLCFSPDEKILYVTDTAQVPGDGTTDLRRPATIYAYDISNYVGAAFLINKRVFAAAAVGIPDGIKCDIYSNVYSGCGDGVEVWNPSGTQIGTIYVPGGVANFCFGLEGEMFLCAETKLWRVQLAKTTRGALLGV